MRRKHFDCPEAVRHPRYGEAPMRSRLEVSIATIRQAYWGYRHLGLVDKGGHLAVPPQLGEPVYGFLGSALAADIRKQRCSVFPRTHYLDLLRTCRSCGAWFFFYAVEQRYWYEVLRFWVDADCVHCCGCRAKDRRLRRAQLRYAQRIVAAEQLDERQFGTLLRDALFLTQSGTLRSDAKLRRLRNLAIKRGYSAEPLAAVSAFLAAHAGESITHTGSVPTA